uniref:Uncharacterized protein n=1 Tax=Oryza meridionalis TaxID=40149 RepID=A0A0E0CUJ6_9ORYZ
MTRISPPFDERASAAATAGLAHGRTHESTPSSTSVFPLPSGRCPFRPNYVRFSFSTVSSSQILLPPSQLPDSQKKKTNKPRILSSCPTPTPTTSRHADHLLLPFRWIPAAVSTSPASPSGVERRRGRWPKVSGVFWKLRCDAPATARKGLQVCDTGVILLVGWGFAFWSRGGLGGRHGLGPKHDFQVWAW